MSFLLLIGCLPVKAIAEKPAIKRNKTGSLYETCMIALIECQTCWSFQQWQWLFSHRLNKNLLHPRKFDLYVFGDAFNGIRYFFGAKIGLKNSIQLQ